VRFHAGQLRAWASRKRVLLTLAGVQSGKTVFGPYWLLREIQERGPGDYLVVTPTYPLLAQKLLPSFRRVFESGFRLGRYVATPTARFQFSPAGGRRLWRAAPDCETNVFFGHASNPESLASSTGKAAWLDEAGQGGFKAESWDEIQARLSVHEGRVLITSRPYNLGWLKQRVYDPWERERKAGRAHPHIDVVHFRSIDNPTFPREEYERARRDLPPWKFALMYDAVFTRPAGLIYDSFDEHKHKVPRFKLPDQWPRVLGLDFGGVNTAGVFYAVEMLRDGGVWTGRLYAYREYKAGSRTAAEHVHHLLKGEPSPPHTVGGSASEGQWRDEFRAAGLPVREPPIKDVEVGIDRVYGAHRRGEILVFEDLAGYLEEKLTYSRELDDRGEPTEKIEDKHRFHFMDAERYALAWAKAPAGEASDQPERVIA